MSLARSAAVAATSGALGLAIGSEKVQLMGGLAKVKAWLGFQAAAVDLTQPDAVLGEALSFAKATPQDCGVLSTRQGGGVASRMVQLKEPFGVQEENGDVRVNFFTSSASRKFKELLADPNCALLYWNPETLTYVMASIAPTSY
ncbi:Putative_PNPOx domain-containing protein [Durusdinium trenchii]|uniref:Putative_PNPOx domain-containing protein n=1 Tax=Durusdinium trenchii TaxID=1381693 RepID=A0ABP0M0J0_9DINO